MLKHELNSRINRMLSRKFDDELHFIRTWAKHPKTTGSIVPTGSQLANSMASLVRVESLLPVLELGPGSGAITRAILETGLPPQHLYALEYSLRFHDKLLDAYPDINLIHGDAFDLNAALAPTGISRFDTIISALPLLNFPQTERIELMESLLDRLPPGRPVVQFSYGLLPPVRSGVGSFRVQHHDWIVRNVPPARVWLYQRPADDNSHLKFM